MSTEDEEILIGEVLKMKEHGFETSRSEVLPNLYVRRYGEMFRENCGSCVKDAYDNLIKWASKVKSTTNKYMTYKFKREYWNKSAPIIYKGQRLIITADNLTEERAQILLATPKYAHILEFVNGVVPITVPSLIKPVKQEKDRVIPPNFITPETEKESSLPNELEVTTSTSKEVVNGEEPVKKKRGRPFAKLAA